MEKQEPLLLETTPRKLIRWKEEIVMAPPGQTANELMIYIHSTVEIGIDIEVTKAKIKLINDKITYFSTQQEISCPVLNSGKSFELTCVI